MMAYGKHLIPGFVRGVHLLFCPYKLFLRKAVAVRPPAVTVIIEH